MKTNKYTKNILLKFGYNFIAKYDKTPTVVEWENESNYPSWVTLVNHFGSFNRFVEALGKEPNRQDYTRKELIEYGLKFVKKYKKAPTISAWDIAPGYPSSSPVRRVFKTFNNFKHALGKESEYRRYSRKELIDYGINFMEKYEKVPTLISWNAEAGYPSYAPLQQEFGGIKNFIRALGKEPDKYSKSTLLEYGTKFIEKYKKVPKCASWDNEPGFPTRSPITRVFGTFNRFIEVLGKKPTYTHYSKKEILEHGHKFIKKYNCLPTFTSWKKKVKHPGIEAIWTHFGNWHAFRQELDKYLQPTEENLKNITHKLNIKVSDLESIVNFFGGDSHKLLEEMLPESYNNYEHMVVDKMIEGQGANKTKDWKFSKNANYARFPKELTKRVAFVSSLLQQYNYNTDGAITERLKQKALENYKQLFAKNSEETLRMLEHKLEQLNGNEPLLKETLQYVYSTLKEQSQVIPLNNAARYVTAVKVAE